MTPLNPVESSGRNGLLDSLRGFALLGIMFVNMTWFTGFAVLSADEKQALGTAGIDAVVYWLIQVLVDGKFWSLFALLFGIGVAIQLKRAAIRQVSFSSLYARRVSVLLGIGLAHAIFLWFGDIVSLYAVAGLALLLFRNRSDACILAWSIGLLLMPVVQLGIWLLAYTFQSPTESADPGYGPAALIPVFGSGTYSEIFLANWAFLKERWVIAIYDGRFLKLGGMFLLGWWAGRTGIIDQPENHRRLLWQVVLAGLFVGLPLNIVSCSGFSDVSLRPPSVAGWMAETIKTIGIPVLCLAYGALFALVHASLRNRKLMTWFALVGRMSLTNYILQSVLGVVIFYGYGFGQWGNMGAAWSVPLILAIFSIQIALSGFWLSQFRFGPLEWIWRCLTYGRWLSLRSEAGSGIQIQTDKALDEGTP